MGLGPYRLVVELIGVMLVFSTLLRALLLVGYVDLPTLTPGDMAQVFAIGLWFDSLIALLCAAPVVALLTAAGPRCSARWSRWLLEAGWSATFFGLPWLCVVEVLFFHEFDSRLNYIAFEYLVYPTEVCCNIQQSYPVGSLLTGIAIVGGVLCLLLRRRYLRLLSRPLSSRTRWAFPTAAALTSAVLLVVANDSQTQVTPNRVANECAANGIYSFVHHAWTCRFEFDRLYLTMEVPRAHARVRERVARPDDRFIEGSANPLDRTVSSGTPQRDYNVVLILEESLGADHVGILGGTSYLTPHFDELTKEGMLFDNFYATGNRTARALEAVMTSLPPIPTESILKRDRSNHVYTLARVLEQRGYERLFMTGGRGTFDGVRPFMTANGFNHFRELRDYPDPVFTNAWGVCDEDLFRYALKEMDALAKSGRPFFTTILTVSNHRPFTYPDGRIHVPSSDKYRDNAVMYADWSLGWFFHEAKERDYYKNTVFLVMGDHGARVYGRQVFPVQSYRVPALLIMPDGEGAGKRCSTLASSIDVAPTILGALGGEYRSVFFGRDVRSLKGSEGYALMQHNHNVAMLDSGHEMTVLGTGKRSSEFDFNPRTYQLKEKGLPEAGETLDVVAFYQTAYELYYGELCYPGSRPMAQARRPRKIPGTSMTASASNP